MESTGEAYGYAKAYFEQQIEYTKLDIAERLSTSISSAITAIVVVQLIFFFLGFLSLALGIYLGQRLDNAPMESFFHTLKVERVHHRVYATRDEARRDLFGYIEGFYNSRRIHSAIGYRSPADMERMAA